MRYYAHHESVDNRRSIIVVAHTVFINYRREDSDASAGRLYDTLNRRLTGATIFMDVDGVRPGEDFTKVLATTLTSTDVMLAVIGPRWITASHTDGTRRLDDPDDFVAREIADALARDVDVVPVLVQGGTMPKENELPPRIRAFATSGGRPRRPHVD